MKKTLTLLLMFLVIAGFTNAQSKIKLSVGANVALPMGSFGDIAGTGFGGTVTGEYPINNQIVGTATVGYISWGTKDFGGSEWSFSAIPVLAGAKYYFDKGLYAHGQLGFHMFSSSVEIDFGPFFGGKQKVDDNSSEFTIGLGAGYEINNFDLSAAYYIISDSNYFGIRAAYKFSL